ncbi:hypothetical protein [Streptomyces violaceus]|uniref:Htaa domain-containing protein n=1 Tax=Streptomyces violaceus TaxID=1936 RepID=A0ABY9UDU9_STRVL|nr:hypothetical protein [Streptomyces janthinus]WND21010.1 hypothetical protein RI060_28370 [Streptomyces janthinus]GGS48746.1 hypothetical protein GCM10010270_18870 [Streptomyces janthinus]
MTGGGADPGTGAADVELGGTARLERSAGPDDPLVLGGLRLELTGDGDGGVLHARAVRDGRAQEVTLVEFAAGGAEPAVRAGGMTWTGLRASLTDEGAGLLSGWRGERFASGDALGVLDVTAGTGAGGASGGVPSPPSPSPIPTAQDTPAPEPQRERTSAPMAAVAHSSLTAGEEQRITGEGFAASPPPASPSPRGPRWRRPSRRRAGSYTGAPARAAPPSASQGSGPR